MMTQFTKKILFILCFFCCLISFSQTTIKGIVTDQNGLPLPGVSVAIKNSSNGTTTDFDGKYKIILNEDKEYTIEYSFIGFGKIQKNVITNGNNKIVDIKMAEDAMSLDQVIVTGTFDPRSKMESSIAITTIGAKKLQAEAPLSYSDILKSVPGVFVNSALGEIRNVVYSRGVSAGSVEAAEGTFYVSLQEDGLPITNAGWQNYGPDYFLRPDLTVDRLEAVRGGSASITSANAPGGIFNYVSKTGGDKFKGIVRTRYGLKSEKFQYSRTEFNVGGPLGNDLYYNVGGFYRYDEGNRNAGYPLNNGGQLKANILKRFETGSIKIYGKYLNDTNGWYEFLPSVDFDNPRLAPGVNRTASYTLPSSNTKKIAFNSSRNTFSYNPGDLINNKEFAIGADYKQDIGDGWKINNNLKVSIKDRLWEGSGFAFAASVDNVNVSHLFTGTAANAGILNFTDRFTGDVLASLAVDPNAQNKLTILSSNLPGQEILKDGIVTGLGLHFQHDVAEIMEKFVINKKLKNMSLTAGVYYGLLQMKGSEGFAGFGWGKLQSDKTELLNVTLTTPNNTVYQFTDPKTGLGYEGGSGWQNFNTKRTQTSVFFGHNWDLSNKLNLDWGIRFESIRSKGTNFASQAASTDLSQGGLDGNPLTQYDNFGVSGDSFIYDKTVNTISFSAGLNYKISKNSAVYLRYSNGKKAPSLKPFLGIVNAESENYIPIPQKIEQIELGLKLRGNNGFSLVATPFYSLLSNVGGAPIFLDDNSVFYSPKPLQNEIRTIGIEIENNIILFDGFSINSAITIQDSKAIVAEIWDAGNPTRSDDKIVDIGSGNDADNSPKLFFTINPTYTNNKFSTGLTWKFIGNRPANLANAFVLPGFHEFDFRAGYNFSKNINLSYNVKNLFQSEGVMSWLAPTKGGQALDRQGFTKQKLKIAKANGDPFSIITVQPRSHFLTLSYIF